MVSIPEPLRDLRTRCRTCRIYCYHHPQDRPDGKHSRDLLSGLAMAAYSKAGSSMYTNSTARKHSKGSTFHITFSAFVPAMSSLVACRFPSFSVLGISPDD